MEWIFIVIVVAAIFAAGFSAGHFLGRVKERNEPKEFNIHINSLISDCTFQDVPADALKDKLLNVLNKAVSDSQTM